MVNPIYFRELSDTAPYRIIERVFPIISGKKFPIKDPQLRARLSKKIRECNISQTDETISACVARVITEFGLRNNLFTKDDVDKQVKKYGGLTELLTEIDKAIKDETQKFLLGPLSDWM